MTARGMGMLKSWSIENFKSIVKSGKVELAPVTVLAGLNSSGKSSFLQSILMISQTLSSRLLDRPLLPNGPIVQLGTFEDILNSTSDKGNLSIGFELDFSSELQDDPIRWEDLEDDIYFVKENTGVRASSVTLFIIFDNNSNEKHASIGNSRITIRNITLTVIPEINMSSRKGSGETNFTAKELTKKDLSIFMEKVSKGNWRLIPYIDEYSNYIGKLGVQDTIILDKCITTFAHFLPNRFIQKKNLRKEEFNAIMSHLQLLESKEVATPQAIEVEAFPEDMYDIVDKLLDECGIEYRLESMLLGYGFGDAYDEISAWFHFIESKFGEKKAVEVSERLRELLKQELLKLDDLQFEILEVVPDNLGTLNLGQAVEQTTRFFTSKIRYLGPLRADPQASQKFAPSSELDDVGAKGEYAAAVYDANREALIEWYDPNTHQIKQSALEQALDTWAQYLGVAKKITINAGGQSGFSWQVTHKEGYKPLPLAAVGVGVSQILPILVMGLLAPKHTLLIIEQPELHLHPRVQGRLGDFFMGLAKCEKQCLIETHSEYVVNQLRYHIVEAGGQEQSDCLIYFVDQGQQGTTYFVPVEISPQGNILNWPEGFFEETMLQEDRITAASLNKRAEAAARLRTQGETSE